MARVYFAYWTAFVVRLSEHFQNHVYDGKNAIRNKQSVCIGVFKWCMCFEFFFSVEEINRPMDSICMTMAFQWIGFFKITNSHSISSSVWTCRTCWYYWIVFALFRCSLSIQSLYEMDNSMSEEWRDHSTMNGKCAANCFFFLPFCFLGKWIEKKNVSNLQEMNRNGMEGERRSFRRKGRSAKLWSRTGDSVEILNRIQVLAKIEPKTPAKRIQIEERKDRKKEKTLNGERQKDRTAN